MRPASIMQPRAIWSVLLLRKRTLMRSGPFYYCASVLAGGPSPRATNFLYELRAQNDSIGLIHQTNEYKGQIFLLGYNLVYKVKV